MLCSMIYSLRQRLEELERTAGMPPGGDATTESANGGFSPVDGAQVHRGSDTMDELLLPVSETVEDTTGPCPLLINNTSIHHHRDEAESSHSVSVTSRLPNTSPDTAPSQCIQPGSFERLMQPIEVVIDRRTDVSPGAGSLLPSDEAALPAEVESPPCHNMTSCTCDRLLDTVQWRLPLRRRADELVAIFFARFNRMFPILHRPTFMAQYETLWESRFGLTGSPRKGHSSCTKLCKQKSKGKLFSATVNAVFSLAALFSSRNPEHNAFAAREFFNFAEGIDILDLLDNELGLESVQLVLLMALYLQSTERFSKCWNMAGLAIRMAQNMGLHFGPAEARSRRLLQSWSTQLECEMRARVWHCCVILEWYAPSPRGLFDGMGAPSLSMPQID